MHPTKVIVQSLDALLHGSWRESLCDVYISTSELRFLHVPISFMDVSVNRLMDLSCCTETLVALFFAFVYMYVCFCVILSFILIVYSNYSVNMVLFYYLQKYALLIVCFRNFYLGDEVTLFTTVLHFCLGKLIFCVNVPPKLHFMG